MFGHYIRHALAFIKFEDHFNSLETVPIPDQYLTAGVIGFAFLVQFHAGFVVDVDAPLDDFAAALAFHGKRMKHSSRVGRKEKVFEETHGGLLFM